MAVLKCKMCGGDIVVNEEKTYGMCDYCGSTMTLPKVSDDQRAARFNRGNHFRRQGDFDKALAVYETIVNEDETDAEAHWCCALCRFGIEYVEDPNTYEYLPTCHRASFDSFLEDADYLAALEYSDGITKRQYQKDATKIAEVQRGILATSQNEQPYDIFICYKETDDNTKERTRDSLDAQDIYYQLTQEGYRVFFSRITLEDKVGAEYEPYIFAALNSAKVMIAIGSKPEYFNAVWVKNEWSRFLSMMHKDRSKLLLPCYKDMDPYDLPEQLGVLQSYDMSKIGFVQDLIRGVKKVLTKDNKKQVEVVQQTTVQQSGGNIDSLLKRVSLLLEDEEWESAEEYCQKVLDIDPENGEAYLGLVMAKKNLRNKDAFASAYIDGQIENYNKNLKRAIQFADEKLEKWFDEIDKKRNEEEEKRKGEERKQVKNLTSVRERISKYRGLLSAKDYTVGLNLDGTVVAVGRNDHGQCDVEGWTDIVAVSAGSFHTVGLKADGTVIATKYTGAKKFYGSQLDVGQCNVQNWTDIVAVSAGGRHTVGLKSDGTVVAVGEKKYGQCDVQDWTDIVAVSVAGSSTVGLKSDGTVVAVGNNDNGQCDVQDWIDIVAVSAGILHTVGLKSDGTVVATKYTGNQKYYHGQCDVEGWTDIVAVSAGFFHTVGLKSDGTVVATKYTGNQGDNYGQCDVQDWTDIVAVSVAGSSTVGLKSDGTVVAVGNNDNGQCDVTDWKLFKSEEEKETDYSYACKWQESGTTAEMKRAFETFKSLKDYKDSAERARECMKPLLSEEKTNLQTELANLKGVFSGARRKKIEARLAEIELVLQKL